MKYLFFLIIIPFLLIPTAYAEKGKNFDTVENPNGSITWTSHYDRILDSNDEYQDFIFTNHPNFLQVETAGASVQLDKNSCKFVFYNSGIIGNKVPILIDDIIPYRSINGSGIWNVISSLDDAACETEWNGTTLTAKKNVVGLGNLEYSYKFTGTSWKTELKVTNLSGLNDRIFGFEQLFNLNRDSISFGGNQINLDNQDGSIFDRTFLETNEAKVIDLLNGFNYDFDLGFEKLNKVWINDTGVNSSLLTFQYFFNQNVLPDGETLIIDPTFGFETATYDAFVRTANAAGGGCPAPLTLTTTGLTEINKGASGGAANCTRTILEWDITGINDNVDLISVVLRYEVNAISNPQTCDFNSIEIQPTTLGVQDTWDDIGNGTTFVSNNADCITTGIKTLNLGTSAISDLDANLVSNWWGLGVKFNSEVRGGVQNLINFVEGSFEIQVTFSNTNAVTDLIITDERGTAIDLSWSAPSVIVGAIDGYQINFTTPHNLNVASIANGANNTGNTGTTATVSGLMGLTNYSFRVGVWNTLGGINASGNVVNGTTTFDPTGAFSAGSFNITQVGIDVRNFKFERIDLNTTALLLNVTYPNTFNSSCNFYFKFAMVNQSHFNLADIPVNSNEDEASFRFEGVDNEIIEVTCQDHNSNVTGDYLITQSSFMILQQIQDFQSGTFGTMGKFGALDLITVFAVTISMIGFNRINESVGVILSVLMIGGFSVFGLIQWETTFTASLALAVLWAYTNTRKT